MKFHKIIRIAVQPRRADKSAMCAINRHLLYCLPPSTPSCFPYIVPVTRYARPFGEGLDGVSKGHDVVETGRCRWWETIHLLMAGLFEMYWPLRLPGMRCNKGASR